MSTTNSKSYRGSEWRKWDLHIHTPISYMWTGPKDENAYKEIIEAINSSDVASFAITDYWTFDGFKQLMKINKKLQHGDRLKKLILPGIELRFDILTDDENVSDKTRVNFQIIFNSDNSEKKTLDRLDQFYSKLKLSNTDRTISPQSFIEIAKKYSDDVLQKLIGKKHSECIDEDFLVAGYKSCYISYDCIVEILKIKELRDNLLVIVPWDKYGGISKIDPILRDDVKKNLTQLADALETTKEETIKLFLLDNDLLLSKSWAVSWRQFLNDLQKPCICGSDAKEKDAIGVFPNNKNCWIKADPTFEGLKQIICEPQDRVFIGEQNPALFGYVVVNSFSVSEENEKFFFKKIGNIYFNPGLNCVIGSRGSGKSVLLDAIAFSLGDVNVLNKQRNNYVGFFFEKNNDDKGIIIAKVKHSHSGEERELSPNIAQDSGFLFDYYHQKYIGYLADPNNEEELSHFLFKKIFQDDPETSSLFNEIKRQREDFGSQLEINRGKVIKCEKEISKEEEIYGKIKDKNNRARFLSQPAIKHLIEERNKIIKLKERIKRIKLRLENIEKRPLISDADSVDTSFFRELLLSKIDPKWTILPKKWKILEKETNNFLESLGSSREELEKKITGLTEKVIELEPSFDFDEQLNAIWENIKEESVKQDLPITEDDLEKLDSIQKEIVKLEEQLGDIKKSKKEKQTLFEERRCLLDDYTSHLNSVKKSLEKSFKELLEGNGAILNNTIGLELTTVFPIKSYLERVRDKAKHDSEDDSPNFPPKKPLLGLFKSLGPKKVIDSLRSSNFKGWSIHGLGTKSLGYFQKIQNKEEVAMHLEELLPGLTSRLLWRPDSKKEFKLLKNCSIGERGTALLSVILIVGIEPLIIDQPEDDLDHFYLYKTLTSVIKEVKKRRQLIFATHDANIVINGDAELIFIVATEDGKFGSIIPTSIENSDIRERIMDILEGGKTAFRKRREKYGKTAE